MPNLTVGQMKTLAACLPPEFLGYTDTRAWKLRDVLVVSEHDGCVEHWPGNHVNVYWWYTLQNGMKVGFNENPSAGWSFPVIGKPRKKRA